MDKARRSLLILCMCAGWFGAVGYSRAAVLQEVASKSQAGIAATDSCTPQKAVATPEEVIQVKLWAAPGSGVQQSTWTATGGHIEGRGALAVWSFAGADPGLYTASVHFTDHAGPASCTVTVVVQESMEGERGARRETGHGLLVKGSEEVPGYGLYSYVLLGSAPDDHSRERLLNVMQSILQQSSAIADLEQYFDRKQLNITYIPVVASAPGSPSAQWLLDNYDYARARFIMHSLPGDFGRGPYIVSSAQPISRAASSSGPYLKQDFSAVPPHLVSMWTGEFLNQAAQEHFWEEDTGKKLILHLRTAIGIMAEGLPDVRKSLNDWISFAH